MRNEEIEFKREKIMAIHKIANEVLSELRFESSKSEVDELEKVITV